MQIKDWIKELLKNFKRWNQGVYWVICIGSCNEKKICELRYLSAKKNA
ncbi:hypothetical protein APHDU1_0544 [Anaplasma phagocytophilum]|nr:hypothetical protein APHWEB_0744 [Anaplasma phagocytophilum str. Webster]KJV98111.1 hypothetical protein OTSANNIE_1544 [Anaplasma phagocytophilum str. Annie]KKA00166.1 hypothetical protein APHDU1_0544 [Anaplasma phagocytophilum]